MPIHTAPYAPYAQALDVALAVLAPLDPRPVVWLRGDVDCGMTWKLGDQLIVRAVSDTPDLDATLTAAARWAASGLVAAPHPPYRIDAGELTVTVWEYIDGVRSTWTELGQVLAAFGELPADGLAPWRPLWKSEVRLAQRPVPLTGDERARYDQLCARALRRAHLTPGPWRLVHGDANTRNAVRTPDATVLVDLDAAAYAPAQFDAATVWWRMLNGKITEDQYDAFVAGYGHDVRHDPGGEQLLGVLDAEQAALRLIRTDQPAVHLLDRLQKALDHPLEPRDNPGRAAAR